MQSEDRVLVNGYPSATISSVASADWVCMENHTMCRVILNTGTVTVGGKIKVQKATNKSGSGAADVARPFVNNKYEKQTTASLAGYTLTSQTSSTSVGMITVGNSSDSRIIYADIPATVTSASKAYINVKFVSSTFNMVAGVTYEMYGTRYQQASIPDPTL